MLDAAHVGMASRPHSGEELGGELATGNKADDEGAEAEVLVDVEGQHRHRHANDKEADKDRAHDGEQSGD